MSYKKIMTVNEEELEIFSRQLILNEFNEKSFNKLQNKEVKYYRSGWNWVSY